MSSKRFKSLEVFRKLQHEALRDDNFNSKVENRVNNDKLGKFVAMLEGHPSSSTAYHIQQPEIEMLQVVIFYALWVNTTLHDNDCIPDELREAKELLETGYNFKFNSRIGHNYMFN